MIFWLVLLGLVLLGAVFWTIDAGGSGITCPWSWCEKVSRWWNGGG